MALRNLVRSYAVSPVSEEAETREERRLVYRECREILGREGVTVLATRCRGLSTWIVLEKRVALPRDVDARVFNLNVIL